MSSLRYRIGLAGNAADAKLFHKSPYIFCKSDLGFKKYGVSRVVHVDVEFAMDRIYRIGAILIWGNDQDKIFAHIKEKKYPFVVAFLSAKLDEKHKSFVEGYKGKIHVEVVSGKRGAVDVGLNKWVRKVEDLKTPLYDSQSALRPKSSSHPSPKKDDAVVKVVAKESAAPSHKKPVAEKPKESQEPKKKKEADKS